jgi:hypothetical protein
VSIRRSDREIALSRQPSIAIVELACAGQGSGVHGSSDDWRTERRARDRGDGRAADDRQEQRDPHAADATSSGVTRERSRTRLATRRWQLSIRRASTPHAISSMCLPMETPAYCFAPLR